jgi:multiple sugar transport system substrate-binding protein
MEVKIEPQEQAMPKPEQPLEADKRHTGKGITYMVVNIREAVSMKRKFATVAGIIIILAAFLFVLSRIPLQVRVIGGQLEVVRLVEITTTPESKAPIEPTAIGNTPVSPTDESVITIRWFIPASMEQEQVVQQAVANFNAAHTDIKLVLEAVPDYSTIYEVLQEQIDAGTPPDIVGPVGVRHSTELERYWLDLDPLLTGYDLGGFVPSSVETWRTDEWGLIGLPVGSYPSMILYNKDMFDAAGLAYPPHQYGQPYTDPIYHGDWTIAKMEQIAKLLTLDNQGRNANDPNFDPNNVVQYGFHMQWTDLRGQMTLFGPGSFVGENLNATIPDHWREALHWYYEGMWPGDDSAVFMPNAGYPSDDPFNAGEVAMVHCHTWYPVLYSIEGVANWDIAAVPTYDGVATAKLHTDMMGVMNMTEHPEEAVEALYALATDPDLIASRGTLPALQSLRQGFLDDLENQHPDVDWQVALDGLDHVDVPSHESWMPNYAEAYNRINDFQDLYQRTDGLNLDSEINGLVADLQDIFEVCNGVADVSISHIPRDDLFTGDTILFVTSAEGSTPFTYTWTLDGFSAGEDRNTFEHAFNAPGIYAVGVMVSNQCGVDIDLITVTISDPPPE